MENKISERKRLGIRRTAWRDVLLHGVSRSRNRTKVKE